MKIVECPRDAMQGIEKFIPTELKTTYINQLLQVGFDTIDFGSFVSLKAVPQMADTDKVYQNLALDNSKSGLLAIVANQRGANSASSFENIKYVGFPLSLSETFQKRNTNRTIDEAFTTIDDIQKTCLLSHRKLVVYLSMGFGNPYGDPYSADLLVDFVSKLDQMGITVTSLSDTIGIATAEQIHEAFYKLTPQFPAMEFGAHLHSTPLSAREKIEAVYKSGCQRIDGALMGYGGCPMAEDKLTGNIPTEMIIDVLGRYESLDLDFVEFEKSMKIASQIFSEYQPSV